MGVKLSKTDYDFCGWASRNNLKCADGRIINRDAFADQDNQEVTLVWNHSHNDPSTVLGHALLENRAEGVYTYAKFNNTPSGQNAKELVKNGDVKALSIYANKLKQDGSNVIHGVIREVSLVIAGANPGAYIESVLAHGDDYEDAMIDVNENPEILVHSAEEPAKEEKEEKKEKKEMASEKTVKEVFDEFTEEQKTVVYAMIGQALEDAQNNEDDDEGDEDMSHNLFDNDEMDDVLMHDAMDAILADGKRLGSLKESFLAHADEYGIKDIDWLFPDHHTMDNEPGFIKTMPDEWISIVMNGVHHSPFARIKMVFADITADEARAKGYVKGARKLEEVFSLVKRTVDPTTIYKKQKIDRDDMIDITDFNVVAFIKSEMRIKLDEEIARAILFGDGRSSASADKINETHIIPVCKDDPFYAIPIEVKANAGDVFEDVLIDSVVLAQDDYQGSGHLVGFFAAKQVTKMLLLKDNDGHRMYKNVNEVALAMNIDKVVKVPANIVPEGIYGVVLDLKDYNVGADKGGSISMFDDFDIDYNQQKYLMETRCSGALTKPFSALVFKAPEAQG